MRDVCDGRECVSVPGISVGVCERVWSRALCEGGVSECIGVGPDGRAEWRREPQEDTS